MNLSITSTYAIIEDEVDARDLLKAILDRHCPDLQFLGTAPSVAEAEILLQNKPPDILFADIHLKDGNVFQLLERLDSFDFKLIFTTAYDKYALQAFDYSAVHYLLKPFDSEDVINAVKRTALDVDLKDKVDNIISQLNGLKGGARDCVGIPTTNGIRRVLLKQVIRIEADRSYCKICLEDGLDLFASRSLGEIEDQINSQDFFRVHASHLINVNQVKSYEKSEGGFLIMNDDSKVPISRRKKKEIVSLLM